MPVKKDVDSIAFYQKVSTKRMKLYYSGERVMPVLEHPTYGVFDFEESDSSFSVPKEYGKLLLAASPNLFSEEKTKGLKVKEKPYGELVKEAEAKGYDTKNNSRKAKDLQEFLSKEE